MDKPWNDLSRAWKKNHLGRGETYLVRGKTYLERGQGYQNFQVINFIFSCYNKILGPHKKNGQQLGFNLVALDGTRIRTHTVLRDSILGPYS